MLNFKVELPRSLRSSPGWVPGLLLCVSLSACLGACTSAPKPSTVDESTRRPANDPARIEQLREQMDGERTHMEADLVRRQRTAYQTAQEIRAEALRPPVRVQRVSRAAPGVAASSANTVYTARFASGSAQLAIGAEDAKALLQAAQLASAIVVRGRTDAEQESLSDSRLARERAEAMRKFLVGGGISAQRIRVQYQGAGDFVADNGDAEGRALNRRVEVELYGAAPGVTALEPSTLSEALSSSGSRNSSEKLPQKTARNLSMQKQSKAGAVSPLSKPVASATNRPVEVGATRAQVHAQSRAQDSEPASHLTAKPSSDE